MNIPDEEISKKIAEKLTEAKHWNQITINKISTWVKDGKISSSDLIFLIENPRPEKSEAVK